MNPDTLSIILKYIDDETIKLLFNNTDNICIKKEYYDRFYVNYSKIKRNYKLIKKINIDTNVFNLDNFTKLTHLYFRDNFNQPIRKGVLPNSLTHLAFGGDFNQPIEKDVLPNSLKHLEFGYEFNQPIGEGVLPDSLIYLQFIGSFNQPIGKGVLPNSLKCLNFGKNFNYPINNILPDSLIYLKIGYNIIIDEKE